MRHIYLLLLIHCIAIPALAQTKGSLKGVIFDTLAKQPVPNATITVLKKKDSSLVTFTMTDTRGRFEVDGLANGDYRLLITHINFHNVNKTIAISDSTKDVDLQNIAVTDVTKMLDEVVVTAEAPPVTLVGDTIQYNAGSFKTPPNANVEQMLKRMPGMEVDKDGTITAQGQKVGRVLVDGKEFFGKDPKMATRNLPADAIDKVQVYDKLSDAAQLTGFDDGNSEKTINLKLKEDKKKGAFGKITAGAGTNDRYEGRFNVNSFKGARQLSVVGMGNNTNTEGFSFSDMLSFSGGINKLMQGGGVIQLGANDPLAGLLGSGGANSTGLRTIWGGGVNYNNIIGKKTQFTSNYFYNHYNPNSERSVERQYFLPDSSYFYNQQTKSDNKNDGHRVNLSADIQLDSLHSLKISPSFGYQSTRNRSMSTYQTLSEEKALTNSGNSNNYSTSDGYNFDNEILFRKKFLRKGRTLSLTLQTSLNNSDGNGSQQSITDFYKGGVPVIMDTINQRNVTNSNMKSYLARAVYTEPLSRLSLLEFSIGRSNSKSVSDKVTYDYNKQNGKFDDINDSLSNNFANTYGYTNGGIRYRYQQKRYSLAVGLSGQKAELEGTVTSGIKDSVIGKTFYNLLPNARFQYNLSQYRKLTLNYVAYTNQPTVAQLQPIPDISNRLSIREGNPDLKQEYSHSLQLSYTALNPFRGKSLFINASGQQTQNKIVNYDQIDSLGIRTTKPVNVNGVYNVRGSVNLRLPVRFIKGNVTAASTLTYNKGKQFINKVANDISTVAIGPSLRLSSLPTDKLELIASAGVNYNKSAYSLQSALNTKYVSQQYTAEVNWQLPANYYLSTDFTYTINNQLASGFNAKVPLWNASFSKQFLKYNRGEIKLTVFDLLNKNIGINRTSNQNYIEDSRTTNLQRYFMLSFTYSLTKMGGGAGPVGGRAMMIAN